MTYVFNRNHPPLLSQGLDYDPQSSQLSIVVAEARPADTTSSVDSQSDHFQYLRQYKVRRIHRWNLEPPVYHYAARQTVERQVTTGYDKTERESVEKALSATAGAEGFGLSLEIKAELNVTNETIKSWHESTSRTETTTFEADTTYAFWSLLDVIEVDVKCYTQYEYKGADPPGWGEPVTESSSMSTVLMVYEDKLANPGAEVVDRLQAACGNA